MDRACVRFADIKRVAAIGCFEHFVAANLEHLTRKLPDEIGILGDQYGLTSFRCYCNAWVVFQRLGYFEETRQIHLESGAFSWTAFGRNVSTTLLYGNVH